MHEMPHIQLICFDEPSTNKAYCEYLSGIDLCSSGS